LKQLTLFQDFEISQPLKKAISKMGFEEATPIQAQTIPVTLEGNDVIGQAQTGTGKTAAFGIPLIEKIDVNSPRIQAIVIAPTRELAIQVSEELYKIGYYKRVQVLSVYGGQEIGRQIRALKKGPQIIVGTPGRMLDHINRKTIRLQDVQTVVLDEADEMLNMGFIEDIESILKEVPSDHQTLLFSATMPKPIQAIAERFMHEPKVIKTKSKEVTVANIEQYYIETQEQKKFDALTRLLDIQAPELAIVFGRTKRRVDELSEALQTRGYAAQGIHGDLTQGKRMKVLRQFKERSIDILVATDVAARGLDISGVSHVYNFDLPQDPESYVHRIGRTGRAGKQGKAMTFVTPREIPHLKNVEATTKRRMEPMTVPSLDDALEGQQRLIFDQITKAIGEENLSSYEQMAENLLEKNDAAKVVAAALKLMTKEPDTTPVKLTSEPPLQVKKDRKKSYGKGNYSKNKRNYRNKDGRQQSSRSYDMKQRRSRTNKTRKSS
jgi:ATP-dependent RNA helicase DeaD